MASTLLVPEELSDRIRQQRERSTIEAELKLANAVGVPTTEVEHIVSRLQLEVLFDIRDRLAEMREWLPSRD